MPDAWPARTLTVLLPQFIRQTVRQISTTWSPSSVSTEARYSLALKRRYTFRKILSTRHFDEHLSLNLKMLRK
jgi:hypothetical protein